MPNPTICSAIILFGILVPEDAFAQEVDKQPSAFESILQRVVERDEDSGAIVAVSAQADSPEPTGTFSLSIKPMARSSTVLVELRGIPNHRVVYESYRLRFTPQIKAEAEKLKVSKTALRRRQTKQQFVFLRIQHLRQGKNLCVPTSASMALLYFGKRLSPTRIKELANSVTEKPEFAGTYFEDLVNGLKQDGINWDLEYYDTTKNGFDTGLAAIRASLDAGNPVIVDTKIPPVGHTVLINGYDPHRQLISIVDPLIPSPGLRKLSYSEFMANWKSLTVDLRSAIFTRKPTN